MKRSKRGFTLIELIVVISIIGLLGTLGFTSYNTSLQKSRDARRKSDLQQIMVALQLYYNDNGVYPDPAPPLCRKGSNCFVNSAAGAANPWIPALTSEYIENMPRDPKNTGPQPFPWVTGDYYYAYGNVTADGQSFDLISQLEWQLDPDRCAVKHYKQYGGPPGTDWCGIYSPYLYQQTPP